MMVATRYVDLAKWATSGFQGLDKDADEGGHEARQGQRPAARQATQAQTHPKGRTCRTVARRNAHKRRTRRAVLRRPLHCLPGRTARSRADTSAGSSSVSSPSATDQIRAIAKEPPRTTESVTAVPRILPSLCRQPPRIRAHNGELSRMRTRRWRACTNKCEPSRTGLQSPCKRAVVPSTLDNGSAGAAAFVRGDLHFRRCQRHTA